VQYIAKEIVLVVLVHLNVKLTAVPSWRTAWRALKKVLRNVY